MKYVTESWLLVGASHANDASVPQITQSKCLITHYSQLLESEISGNDL